MTKLLWPPLELSDIPDSRAPGEPWHKGLMVTQSRAIAVATALFPSEVADGSDCRAQYDRVGEPCLVCADRNQAWINRVREVRAAIMAAF